MRNRYVKRVGNSKRGGQWLRFCGCTLAILLFYAPFAEAQSLPTGKIKAYVSIAPQAFFLERIGGTNVEIEILVPPGQSPATFEPTPKQMAGLADADIYFRVGLPFEDQLLKKLTTTNNKLLLIDTRKGITLRSMEEEAENGHEQHDHGRYDPHIWLDPGLVKIQAQNIVDGLVQLDSASRKIFSRKLIEFSRELKQIDSTIARILAPLRGRKFFVFHPSYGYFAEAYGLQQVAVETGGKEPGARQLAELIDLARQDSVRVVFVQPQFSQKSANTIAKAINGAVVPLDPLAPDYLDNLGRMARAIERALATNEVKSNSNK